MLILFCVAAAWLGYLYLGYPFLLAILGWIASTRIRKLEGFTPKVSVLISARNEVKDIGWKISETLSWAYPSDRIEVLVASDASADSTDDAVRAVADARVKFIRMERRGGKARALNRLAADATGELLFFTDANAHIGPEALARMVRHFADETVGCVTGHSAALMSSEADAAISGGVYFGMEALVRKLESRIGSVLTCDGAIFMIRRALFHTLDPDLANDLELPVRIGGLGYRVVDDPDGVVFEKDTASVEEEVKRRPRICAQGLLGMWRLRHSLHGMRAWQFFSHKFLRWFTAVPITLVLVTSACLAGDPVFRVILAGGTGFLGAALTGLLLIRLGRPAGIFSAPLFIILTSAGALAGIWDACSGRKFDIWDSPALTRGGLSEAADDTR